MPAKKPKSNTVSTTSTDTVTLDFGYGAVPPDYSNVGYGAVPPDYSNVSYSGSNDTITIDTSSMYSSDTITFPSSSNAFTYSGAGATVGGITTIGNITGNSQWTTGYTLNNTITPGTVNISATGIDMAAGTDITVGGQSLKEFMKKMEQRLAILVPDPKKLEKFEALKKAYEHYKTMESLCFDEPIE